MDSCSNGSAFTTGAKWEEGSELKDEEKMTQLCLLPARTQTQQFRVRDRSGRREKNGVPLVSPNVGSGRGGGGGGGECL